MIRLSGGMLLVVVLMGLVLGVPGFAVGYAGLQFRSAVRGGRR